MHEIKVSVGGQDLYHETSTFLVHLWYYSRVMWMTQEAKMKAERMGYTVERISGDDSDVLIGKRGLATVVISAVTTHSQ